MKAVQPLTQNKRRYFLKMELVSGQRFSTETKKEFIFTKFINHEKNKN